MKSATVLMSLLLIQTGTSTFTEGIDRVMTNMESSVGQLIGGVITGMKDAIDCAILAMEKTLSLENSDWTTEYQRKCVDGTSEDEGEPKDPAAQNGENLSNEVVKEIEHVEDQLSSVITDMNNTFHNVIDSNDVRLKLNRVRLMLKNETDHLASVSALFKGKLDKFSNKIKYPDQSDDYFNEIYRHLKLLHEAEKTENNVEEIHEIHDVINEILNILQLDKDKLKAVDDEDKIQAIIDKLSQQAKTNETSHQTDDGGDKSTEVSDNKVYGTDTKTTNTITAETTNTATTNDITENTRSRKKEWTKKKSKYEDPYDLSNLYGLDEVTVSGDLPDDLAQIMKSQKESEFMINKYFNNPHYIMSEAFPEDEMTDEQIRSFDLDYLFGDE